MSSSTSYQYYYSPSTPNSMIAPRDSFLRSCPHCAHCRHNSTSSRYSYYSGSSRDLESGGGCLGHSYRPHSLIDGRGSSRQSGGNWNESGNNKSSSLMFLNHSHGGDDKSSSMVCLNNPSPLPGGSEGGRRNMRLTDSSTERAWMWRHSGLDDNRSLDLRVPRLTMSMGSPSGSDRRFTSTLASRLEPGHRGSFDLGTPTSSPLCLMELSSGYNSNSPASFAGLSPKSAVDSSCGGRILNSTSVSESGHSESEDEEVTEIIETDDTPEPEGSFGFPDIDVGSRSATGQRRQQFPDRIDGKGLGNRNARQYHSQHFPSSVAANKWDNVARSNLDLSHRVGDYGFVAKAMDLDGKISAICPKQAASGELNSWRSELSMDSIARRRNVTFEWKRSFDGRTNTDTMSNVSSQHNVRTQPTKRSTQTAHSDMQSTEATNSEVRSTRASHHEIPSIRLDARGSDLRTDSSSKQHEASEKSRHGQHETNMRTSVHSREQQSGIDARGPQSVPDNKNNNSSSTTSQSTIHVRSLTGNAQGIKSDGQGPKESEKLGGSTIVGIGQQNTWRSEMNMDSLSKRQAQVSTERKRSLSPPKTEAGAENSSKTFTTWANRGKLGDVKPVGVGELNSWRSELNMDSLAKRRDLTYEWKRSYDGTVHSDKTSSSGSGSQTHVSNRKVEGKVIDKSIKSETKRIDPLPSIDRRNAWRSELNRDSLYQRHDLANNSIPSDDRRKVTEITTTTTTSVLGSQPNLPHLSHTDSQDTESERCGTADSSGMETSSEFGYSNHSRSSKQRRPHSVSFDASGMWPNHNIPPDNSHPTTVEHKSRQYPARRWEETTASSIDLSTRTNDYKSDDSFRPAAREGANKISTVSSSVHRPAGIGEQNYWRSELNVNSMSKNRELFHEWKRSSNNLEDTRSSDVTTYQSGRPLAAGRSANVSSSLMNLSSVDGVPRLPTANDESLSVLRSNLNEARMRYIMKSRENLRLSKSRHDARNRFQTIFDANEPPEEPGRSYAMSEQNLTRSGFATRLDDLRNGAKRQDISVQSVESIPKQTMSISTSSAIHGKYKTLSSANVSDTARTAKVETPPTTVGSSRTTSGFESKRIFKSEGKLNVASSRESQSTSQTKTGSTESSEIRRIRTKYIPIRNFKRPIRLVNVEQTMSDKRGSCLSFSTTNSSTSARSEHNVGIKPGDVVVNVVAQTSFKAGGVRASVVETDRQSRRRTFGEGAGVQTFYSLTEAEHRTQKLTHRVCDCRNNASQRSGVASSAEGLCKDCLVAMVRSIKHNIVRLLTNSPPSPAHQMLASISAVVDAWEKLERWMFMETPQGAEGDAVELKTLYDALNDRQSDLRTIGDVMENIRIVKQIRPALLWKVKKCQIQQKMDEHSVRKNSSILGAFEIAVKVLDELKDRWQLLADKWIAFDGTAKHLRYLLRDAEHMLDLRDLDVEEGRCRREEATKMDWRMIDERFRTVERLYHDLWELGADRVAIRDQFDHCETSIAQLKEREVTSRDISKAVPANQKRVSSYASNDQHHYITTTTDHQQSNRSIAGSNRPGMVAVDPTPSSRTGQSMVSSYIVRDQSIVVDRRQRLMDGKGDHQSIGVHDDDLGTNQRDQSSRSTGQLSQSTRQSHQSTGQINQPTRQSHQSTRQSSQSTRQTRETTRHTSESTQRAYQSQSRGAGSYTQGRHRGNMIEADQNRSGDSGEEAEDDLSVIALRKRLHIQSSGSKSGSLAHRSGGSGLYPVSPEDGGSFMDTVYGMGWPLAFFLLLVLIFLLYFYPPALCCRQENNWFYPVKPHVDYAQGPPPP